MRNLLRFVFGLTIVALMVAAPILYKRWHDRDCRNFRVVEDGILYRSGQLPLHRLQQVVANHGIRTIICLREGTDLVDQQEESWAKGKALNFVRIPPRSWWPDDTGKIPAEIGLTQFRQVMDDPANYPVLVHCFAGIHRTGSVCAVYRMDYQGWTNEEAMAEMRVLGYSVLEDHEDVQGFLARYRSPRTGKTPPIPIIPVNREVTPP